MKVNKVLKRELSTVLKWWVRNSGGEVARFLSKNVGIH